MGPSNPHFGEGFTFLLTSFDKAFDTLVRLRRERILAAEELCYIHFQIQVRASICYITGIGQCRLICVPQQTERYALLGKPPNFDEPQGRIPYGRRLKKLGTLPR